MFSLIIAIISIVLVALLAIAVIYYGGDAFNNGGDSAAIATLQNEGAQIRGAMEAYKVNEGGLPTGTQEEIKDLLVSRGYLKAFPKTSADWTLVNDYAVLQDLPDAQCEAINAKYGIEGIPSCTDASVRGRTVCCSVAE